MFYHFPAIEDLTKMVKRYDSRIYEKHRFILIFGLSFGLGQGSNQLRAQIWSGRAQWEERCLGRRRLCPFQAHQKIDNLPIVASLNRGPVGYVGPSAYRARTAATPGCPIGSFHSYHDLTIIPIIPEEEKKAGIGCAGYLMQLCQEHECP